MKSRRWGMIASSSLVSLAFVLSGCASTENAEPAADAPSAVSEGTSEYGTGDITEYCPDEPSRVAYAKGSNNAWTVITLEEMRQEAAKCDTITEVAFTDAQGDQQKAISDLNGLVAQGFSAIVAQPEFGAAQIPSIAAANDAGVPTVPVISDPGGTVGQDYPALVDYDYAYFGEQQAAWLNETLGGEGAVVFLGGTPGAASSQSFFKGFKTALEQYPGLTLVSDQVVDTNWDAGEKKRVMSGLLAQHGRIDAVVSDYGTTDTGVIDAYVEAGLEPPALATNATSNGNACQWEDTEFPFFSLDGSTAMGKIALRQALATAKGIENPEPTLIQLPVFIDTEADEDPTCEPDLPPSADLSSSLSVDQLKELFG